MDQNTPDLARQKIEMLMAMQLRCYDDGKRFTEMAKLDKIREALSGTSYNETAGYLFRLYSKVPLESLDPAGIIVLSTHADNVKAIKHPFVKAGGKNVLQGTFDNSATNAAALYLMKKGSLPDNVLVAFTGNEEYGMRGAAELSHYLYTMLGIQPFYIALDVTDIGYGKKQFSIENTLSLTRTELNSLIKVAQGAALDGYVYPNALPDEAHQYMRMGAKCCSLCVPTKGPMHSDSGCKMEATAYLGYIDVLEHIAQHFSLLLDASTLNMR